MLADIVEPTASKVVLLRDPDDLPVLATLVSANADFLVTGDAGLLVLRDRYPILRPAELAQRL